MPSRITGGQLEMNTLKRLGSNYGTASFRSCAIPSRKTRMLQWISINYVGVALMEPIVQLLMSYPYKYSSTTCVDIHELHYYAKSEILTGLLFSSIVLATPGIFTSFTVRCYSPIYGLIT